ncbi:MAG: phosphoglucomutase, alpha-D-glucose phosphate-specific, partial [Bacteroidota bacterium]
MSADPLAGQPVPPSRRPNVARIVAAYYTERPDPDDPSQRVSFGTSGHRGRSVDGAFTEAHVLAVSQALVEHRAEAGVTGPLVVGFDTHALSEAAFGTALEVFAANGVDVIVQEGRGYSPTPVVSHAILAYNRDRADGLADGVVITPSHNPPEDGGYKYNPPTGGPAGTDITQAVQDRANAILAAGLQGVRRTTVAKALAADTTHARDLTQPYVDDLGAVLDLEAVKGAGVRLGVDPLGGASVDVWGRVAEAYGLRIEVVNEAVDASFGFMRIDRDGKIRMDCSSPYAMAGLVELKDRFDVAVGCDPDADRHGIVTPSAGLMNPNHYLAVAVEYLFTHRPSWGPEAAVGKTLVSSSMIDRVA